MEPEAESEPDREVTALAFSFRGISLSITSRILGSRATAAASEDRPGPAPAERPVPASGSSQPLHRDYLVDTLVDESGDSLATCVARIERASAAGLCAYNKLTGATRRVPKIPTLASSCGPCAQPRASGRYYYPVLRTSGWQPGAVYTSWDEVSPVVGSPPSPTAIFTKFHFKAEVEAYFRAAHALRLLPLD